MSSDESVEEQDSEDFVNIREAILNVLCLGNLNMLSEKIQHLYLHWSSLLTTERKQFDHYVYYAINSERYNLYNAMIQVFIEWDQIQNDKGAPGCNYPLATAYKDNKIFENELGHIVYHTEVIWSKYREKIKKRKK